MTEALNDTAPSARWTVEGFEYFWSRGRDPQMVAPVVWPEVVGRWPRAAEPVAGREAYIAAIANFLSALDAFKVEVTDHAVSGDTAFVRWVIRGDFPVGPNEMTGVDRLILKDGFVVENHIHSDHPMFDRLAETNALG